MNDIAAMIKPDCAAERGKPPSGGHPLEFFAFFRNWPNPESRWLRLLVLSLIFNAMIAAFFVTMATILGSVRSLKGLGNAIVESMVISNAIGFTWVIVTVALGQRIARMNMLPFPVKVACYTGMGFFVTLFAFYGVFYFTGSGVVPNWAMEPQFYISVLTLSFFISVVLSTAYRSRAAAWARETKAANERERLQAVERQAAQANLRALQAQIEPHFLFNTLANVVGLIHPQPDKAKLMLEQFIVYLRATLSATREAHSTLASEFEMMKNFLAILQIRMGDRLQVRFDLPRDLADFAVPPMLLQPLVENAIKHGLEPKIEGGEVALSVKKMDTQIAITIADTGLGFQNSSSNGIGLKNVCERVQQLYGNEGSVSIEENQPGGTRITILIPISLNA